MNWSESCSVVSDSLRPHGLYSPWNSPGQNTGVSSLPLLQGNLPNPGIEPRSPALKANSLPAEPQGKPNNTGVGSLSLLWWKSWPRNRTGVSCIAGGYFTNWAIRKVKMIFSDIWFVKMLFPPLGYLFIFFTALKNKVLNFYNVLVYFFFITVFLLSYLRNHHLI